MQTARTRSLAGLRVLVTRSKTENESISKKLRELGARIIQLPTIKIIPPADSKALDRAIRNLSAYDWIIFTSVHGVQFFNEHMAALGKTFSNFRAVKVAAIGAATASALELAGRKPDYIPNEFLSEELARSLGSVEGKRILLPRADIASTALPQLLRKRGATVDEIVAYRSILPDDLTREAFQSIMKEGVDIATFTSPSTVRNLVQVVGLASLNPMLRGAKIACIGPVTAEAATKLGLHVDIVAGNHTIDGLVEAIVNEIRTV